MRIVDIRRRRAETFDLEWGGIDRRFAITLGYYDDDALGEVFISGGKSGQEIEAISRDSAVLLSLALQYGATLSTIAGAITRDGAGSPSSIVGAVIDRLSSTAQQAGPQHQEDNNGEANPR